MRVACLKLKQPGESTGGGNVNGTTQHTECDICVVDGVQATEPDLTTKTLRYSISKGKHVLVPYKYASSKAATLLL